MKSSTVVTRSGRHLRVTQCGAPEGVPVIFAHGWPCSGSQALPWHAVAEELGLRIIAPDRPGIGGSHFEPGRKLCGWVSLVEEVTLELGVERFHAVGVSGGGLYTLALAEALPERLLSAHVVSGAPCFHLLGGARALPWHYTGLHFLRRLWPGALVPAFQLGSFLNDRVMTWRLLRWMMKCYLCPRDYEALMDCGWFPCIAQSFREAWTGDLDAMLTDGDMYLQPPGFDVQAIRMPVHFWHGGRDKNIPLKLAMQMADTVPQTVCHWFAEEGHFSLFLLRGREVMESMVRTRAEEDIHRSCSQNSAS